MSRTQSHGDTLHSTTSYTTKRLQLAPHLERRLLLGAITFVWLALAGFVRWHCGSWSAVLDAARGKPVSVQLDSVSATSDEQKAVARLTLRNLLLQDIVLLGAGVG